MVTFNGTSWRTFRGFVEKMHAAVFVLAVILHGRSNVQMVNDSLRPNVSLPSRGLLYTAIVPMKVQT